jgi:hypothetical protein
MASTACKSPALRPKYRNYKQGIVSRGITRHQAHNFPDGAGEPTMTVLPPNYPVVCFANHLDD